MCAFKLYQPIFMWLCCEPSNIIWWLSQFMSHNLPHKRYNVLRMSQTIGSHHSVLRKFSYFSVDQGVSAYIFLISPLNHLNDKIVYPGCSNEYFQWAWQCCEHWRLENLPLISQYAPWCLNLYLHLTQEVVICIFASVLTAGSCEWCKHWSDSV